MMVYRPPSNTIAQDDDFINYILSFGNGKETILMGDLNLPALKWDGNNSRYSFTDFKYILTVLPS